MKTAPARRRRSSSIIATLIGFAEARPSSTFLHRLGIMRAQRRMSTSKPSQLRRRSFSTTKVPTMMIEIPKDHIPPGMQGVHVGPAYQPTALRELEKFGSRRVFVLCNGSSRKFIEGGEGKFCNVLQEMGLLCAPLCTSIGMGGGEEGLLEACDEAYLSNADAVVTIGGGAVQDAGKLIRLWLSTRADKQDDDDDFEEATVEGIQAAARRENMPELPPQIAIPNSFAMAEATHVAGLTKTDKTKSGAAHPSLMPTVIIYDPALTAGLPDWVRFGTALRGIEHAVGAVTHPKADEDIRARALLGLTIINENLRNMIRNSDCPTWECNVYVGGFMAIRALNTGCYPALGHLIQNQYSARFDVHQGSCSGITCARIMDYHYPESEELQKRISAALGDPDKPAPRIVRDIVETLPGVSSDHSEVDVTDEMLKEFTEWMFENHLTRYNNLSPREFTSADDIYNMLTKPLEDL